MNRFLLGSAIAAALVAGAAVAQEQAGDKARPHGWARMLERVDANKDGAISLDEALAATKAHFAKQDANGDGKITEDEIKAARERMRAQFAERGGHHGWRQRGSPDGPGGPEGGRGPGAWGPGGPGGPGGMIARLDTDRDGRLTRAEFDAPFDRMDINHDGVVDQAEMVAAREAMRARFQQMRDRRGGDATQSDTGK